MRLSNQADGRHHLPEDEAMQKLTPCLWFDTQGEDAATFYTSISPTRGFSTSPATVQPGPEPRER